jgi:SAM-dependent methyltransferase
MGEADPLELMYGGLGKLGPGDDGDTLHVLGLLPQRSFELVVDVGCGAGRQTLALARALGSGTRVHALDLHEPFLRELGRRAREANLEERIELHCADMRELPQRFREIDLLWCEGAAYQLGFAEALRAWAPLLRADGCAVVSELCWLTERRPAAALEFFGRAYPGMRSAEHNAAEVRAAGYRLLATRTVARRGWMEGYYDVLEGRARALAAHESATVRELARETLEEIAVFEASAGSYGYVLYALQRG